jgi:CoA-transferase family III
VTSREVLERLGAARVNVAKVHSVGEAADDAQLAESGGVTEFEYAGERVKAVASPFRMLETPTAVRYRPPDSTSIGKPSSRKSASPLPRRRRSRRKAPSATRPPSGAPAPRKTRGGSASRAEAIAAPLASARSFRKAITGSTLPWPAKVPNPQFVPAITRSRPTIAA